MKRKLFFLVSLIISLQAIAQQNHFIYMQTDNRQPFYVKVNGKVISSSATGYAIISKLSRGNLELHIGFPKKEWPEQVINLDVKGDAGYLLKNFGDKGWGLYNMQTMQVAMAGNSVNETSSVAKADQPVLPPPNNNPPVVSETVKVQETAKESINALSPVTEEKPVSQAAIKQDSSPVSKDSAPVPDKSDIKKLYSINQPDGKAVVYIDNPVQYKDTVKIVLQPHKDSANLAATAVVAEKEPEKNTDSRFLDIDMNAKATPPAGAAENKKDDNVVGEETSKTKSKKVKKEAEPYVPVTTEQSAEFPAATESATTNKTEAARLNFNSDCKTAASEDDFYKLRKKMASQRNEENMTSESAKFFRLRCFSTLQVKLLAGLYITEEGKYKFFDTAYPFINDPQNFPKLDVEFKEDYYINRFKAMIRK